MPSRNRNPVQVEQNPCGTQCAKTGIDIGLHRRRVGNGLIDDQVGDGPRIGVGHIARGAIVGVGDHAPRAEVHGVPVLVVAEHWRNQVREGLVSRTEVLLPRHQVVEGAVHGAQAKGAAGVRHYVQQVLAGGMALGDKDLVEDELQVAADEMHARTGDEIFLRQGRRRCDHDRTIHRSRGIRENVLQHAVLVSVDGPHPQGQAVEVGGHTEAVSLGGFRPFAGFCNDVLEDARTDNGLGLPEVGDRTGNGTVGVIVVRVSHQQGRGLQDLAVLRVGVIDLQLPTGACVESGA
ncbi:hypothetical protein D3C84_300790 [compost metagenome]